MTAPQSEPREGNLGDLDDDTYFDSLTHFPGAVDEQGRPVDLFDDVVDARESKRRAREAAERRSGS